MSADVRSVPFDRLRRLSRDELRWRVGTMLRRGAHEAAARVRPPAWRRSDIVAAVVPDADVRAAAQAGDWNAAHDALAARMTGRPRRFVLDPASRCPLREAVLARWPAAAADASAHADAILRGEYDLLGYRHLVFGESVRDGANGTGHTARSASLPDWHLDPVHRRRAPRLFHARVPYLDPATGDHKIIWELNRHQHWLRLGRAAWLTGERRYSERIVDELEDWLAGNPPLIGINWASMLECGFRAITWTWAAHSLLGPVGSARTDERPWLVDLLVGLDRQLTHVERNLSYYFSPNTHLTGEALALYVAGTALPELAASSRWAATGRRVLLAEARNQVLADGGHVERSAHYQRYTLDFYLLALLTARLAGDTDAESQFVDTAMRLAECTLALADDEGRLPLIGDDDGGMLWPLTGRACSDVRDSLSIAAAVLDRPALARWGTCEEAFWVVGVDGAARSSSLPSGTGDAAPGSRLLEQMGYVVLRSDRGDHAVLDTGAHGYMNGGHAHADALSMTLTLDHRPLLVDRGTCAYTIDPEARDRFRRTASHNTITVGSRSSSDPAGPFHWRTRTDARLIDARLNPRFDWAEAAHDGYAPVEHRRAVVRTNGAGWLIADLVTGETNESVAAHWQLDPAWRATADTGRLHLSHEEGASAWLLHDGIDAEIFHGDTREGLGWHAPVYGVSVPATTARLRLGSGTPRTLASWVGDARTWRSPSLHHLPVTGLAGPAVAIEVRDDAQAAAFFARFDAPDAHAVVEAAGYRTDARVLCATRNGDRQTSVALVNARMLVGLQAGWLSIESDETIADLHVSMARGVLDLRAATTPPPLRLAAVTRFHIVRLNGQIVPLNDSAAEGRLLIHPRAWRSHDSSCAAGSTVI